MRAVVLYESMFGNTRDVATAIAEGLGTEVDVEVVEVSQAPSNVTSNVDLLVLGGPTHALGMSRDSTRTSAIDKAGDGLVSPGIGLREWLAAVQMPPSTAVAVFDTRVDKPRVPGSAAASAHRKLRRLGARPVAPAENFFVEDMTGPLLVGELDRARRWGEQLAAKVTPAPA